MKAGSEKAKNAVYGVGLGVGADLKKVIII
jgi:hypothetical protein